MVIESNEALFVAQKVIDMLNYNINQHIYDEFIKQQSKPFAIENFIQIWNETSMPSITLHDNEFINKFIDGDEEFDEPIVPVKDPWWSDFINVEIIERIDVHEHNENENNSPKSVRSISKSTMSVMRRKQTKLYKDSLFETKKENKPVKIEIIEKLIPKEEQILRDRKEKQILHQKWEARELKKQMEEEKLAKLK